MMPDDELCLNYIWEVEYILVVQDFFDIFPVNITWLLDSNLPSLVLSCLYLKVFVALTILS